MYVYMYIYIYVYIYIYCVSYAPHISFAPTEKSVSGPNRGSCNIWVLVKQRSLDASWKFILQPSNLHIQVVVCSYCLS